jgi:hypothetical protein
MKIITTPDSRLREKSEKVHEINDEILDIIENMRKLSLDWEKEHPYDIVENENGVKLISGYSQHIIDMILSDKLDPYEVLLEKLMSERYDVVKTI